ncbi:hypothetical protein FB451DRAFT_1174069 [Mycena latifolia]|nr:hypothetical protein FB451DRAFT_1174069 [Mycena latifolia]
MQVQQWDLGLRQSAGENHEIQRYTIIVAGLHVFWILCDIWQQTDPRLSGKDILVAESFGRLVSEGPDFVLQEAAEAWACGKFVFLVWRMADGILHLNPAGKSPGCSKRSAAEKERLDSGREFVLAFGGGRCMSCCARVKFIDGADHLSGSRIGGAVSLGAALRRSFGARPPASRWRSRSRLERAVDDSSTESAVLRAARHGLDEFVALPLNRVCDKEHKEKKFIFLDTSRSKSATLRDDSEGGFDVLREDLWGNNLPQSNRSESVVTASGKEGTARCRAAVRLELPGEFSPWTERHA